MELLLLLSRTLKDEYTFSQVNPRSSSLRQLAVTLIGA